MNAETKTMIREITQAARAGEDLTTADLKVLFANWSDVSEGLKKHVRKMQLGTTARAKLEAVDGTDDDFGGEVVSVKPARRPKVEEATRPAKRPAAAPAAIDAGLKQDLKDIVADIKNGVEINAGDFKLLFGNWDHIPESGKKVVRNMDLTTSQQRKLDEVDGEAAPAKAATRAPRKAAAAEVDLTAQQEKIVALCENLQANVDADDHDTFVDLREFTELETWTQSMGRDTQQHVSKIHLGRIPKALSKFVSKGLSTKEDEKEILHHFKNYK